MNCFVINVKYEVGYCDIDIKSILTKALQKYYTGFNYNVIFEINNKIKNYVELLCIDSKYENETYKVIYNQDLTEHDELDNQEDIFNFVNECIKRITHYTYRSIYDIDTLQKTNIKILNITINE